jgi:hypothetical protein
MSKKLLGLLVVGAFIATMAAAAGDQDDPPGRAARVSYVNGTVSFQPAGVDDWVPAELNRPLTTGDRIWTDEGGRAELNVGTASLRLDGHTNFSFINLDDIMVQAEVSLGTLSLHVRDLPEGSGIEIDTPHLAFSLLRPGDYRIDVSAQGDATLVTVRGGEGEANADGHAYTVHARERVRLNAAEPPEYFRDEAPAADQFDQWCTERDRRFEHSISSRYVAPDVPGTEDLDDNGIWRNDPEYGQMWMPSGVSDDWAPYRSGHWAWVAPWGWTWVDDASWGYAPFHYGRWVVARGGWGWIPGPLGGPSIFSPAMVAWMGGDDFIVGGELGIGWFPLGPGDIFIPGFHASPLFFERINMRNTIVVRTRVTSVYTNVYVNRNFTNVRYLNANSRAAVTTVPHSVLTSGRSVAGNFRPASPGTLAVRQFQHTAPFVPQREAVLGGRSATYSKPPASTMNRPLVAKVNPPAGRQSFAQQREAMGANPGRAPAAPHTVGPSAPGTRFISATQPRSAPAAKLSPGPLTPASRPAPGPEPRQSPGPLTPAPRVTPSPSPGPRATPGPVPTSRSAPEPTPRSTPTPAPAPRSAAPLPAPRPASAPAPAPTPRQAPAPAPAPRPAPAPAPRQAPAPPPPVYHAPPPPVYHAPPPVIHH